MTLEGPFGETLFDGTDPAELWQAYVRHLPPQGTWERVYYLRANRSLLECLQDAASRPETKAMIGREIAAAEESAA